MNTKKPDNETLYAPCPCGSGRKYKFCCFQRQREARETVSAPALHVLPTFDSHHKGDNKSVLVGDLDLGERMNKKGYLLMHNGEYREAIKAFRTSIKAAPFVPNPHNNLALCLFATGKLDEAISAQQDGLDASFIPNAFGLCNLAQFHMVSGDWDKAKELLQQSIPLEILNADARIKQCETLARFGLHQELLELADSYESDLGPDACFLTGVAAANLGLRERAQADLKRVKSSHGKYNTAREYLRFLDAGESPHTVEGDWPYFRAQEICPIGVLDQQIKQAKSDKMKKWIGNRTAVEFCVALLNDTGGSEVDAVEQLATLTHPRAKEVLWAVAKGSFGPDAIRLAAARCLRQAGELKPGEQIDLLLNGKRSPIVQLGIQLNSEHTFSELPSHLDELARSAFDANFKGKWVEAATLWLKVLASAPHYYPAKYNLCTCLLHQGDHELAESLIRELVEAEPDYLFARGTLLQLLVIADRMEEADELLRSTKLPDETHPAAMVAWLTAQAMYWMARDNCDAAEQCIQLALQIDPENAAALNLQRDLKER